MSRPRRRATIGAALIAAAIAGCSGSTHSSTSSAPSGAPARIPTSTAVGTAASAPVPTATTTGTATRATPPPPSAAGPPASSGPPSGLRAATGYASYELCAGGCSGSLPASIRRPLHLPGGGSPCPVSAGRTLAGFSGPVLGSGPVLAMGPNRNGVLSTNSFLGSAWSGGRVTWVSSAAYRGPLLIRGRELGGSRAVGFGEGHVPIDELQLSAPAATSPGEPAGAREWPSFARVKSPGCYGFQLDGTSFSTTIIVRAAGT